MPLVLHALGAFSDVVTVYVNEEAVIVFILFIFVTKMSFCFHTIEIKSCKKNLHKKSQHYPLVLDKTQSHPNKDHQFTDLKREKYF